VGRERRSLEPHLKEQAASLTREEWGQLVACGTTPAEAFVVALEGRVWFSRGVLIAWSRNHKR
jgi:hypothetical protein